MEYKGRSKEQRRTEGEERNARWRSLSITQQLEELSRRPGKHTRQTARINKVIASAKNKLTTLITSDLIQDISKMVDLRGGINE